MLKNLHFLSFGSTGYTSWRKRNFSIRWSETVHLWSTAMKTMKYIYICFPLAFWHFFMMHSHRRRVTDLQMSSLNNKYESEWPQMPHRNAIPNTKWDSITNKKAHSVREIKGNLIKDKMTIYISLKSVQIANKKDLSLQRCLYQTWIQAVNNKHWLERVQRTNLSTNFLFS